MPMTIASILDNSSPRTTGAKRPNGRMPNTSDIPNKRRALNRMEPLAFSPLIEIKLEEEILECESCGCSPDYFTLTHPGFSYWLSPPGELRPLYEPGNFVQEKYTPSYKTTRGIGLGLGVTVSSSTIEAEPETSNVFFKPESSPPYSLSSPPSRESPTEFQSPGPVPSPRYVPPSPLDVLARCLVRSFENWRVPSNQPPNGMTDERWMRREWWRESEDV